MKIKDHFPIKWKLSLALIATGLGLVLIYVVIANRVFESDKISYVFESQSSRLNSLRREIDGRLEQALLSSQSLLATLDSSGNMPAAASHLFKNSKSLLGIELWDEDANKTIFKIEKTAGLMPAGGSASEKVAPGEIKVIKSGDQNFILAFRPYQDKATLILARVLVDAHDFLPVGESNQPLLLVQNSELVASAGILSFEPSLVPSLVTKSATEASEKTSLWILNGHRFLISTANLSFGNLKILAFTPEEEALGALRTLFYRSIVFLAFSIFGLIIISLLLAKTLTSNLETLTLAAEEIGQGEFDKTPVIKSRDEMGVLSKAFIKMSQEIKRLLIETRDKARMESELKTAKLVQESLLPTKASFEFGELEIDGIVLNSTECGGDWWYYFTRGSDLYIAIADATGHGTPAALITAAARSIFSRLEREDLSLAEMMQAWDFAVSSCSQRRVFMTGMLFKINSVTGKGKYLSAGHEAPYLFNETSEGYSSEFLDLDKHRILGEGIGNEMVEQAFELQKNSSLVLFTDGLFSVEASDGKKLSERRFGKALASRIEFFKTAKKVTELVLGSFEDHRKNVPLPDDVTLVTVRRKGPSRESQLLDEAGNYDYDSKSLNS